MTPLEAKRMMDDTIVKCEAMRAAGLAKEADKALENVIKFIAHELPAYKHPSGATKKWLDKFITNDPLMIKLKKRIEILVNEQDSVLIMGESGTGKEALAHALHGERGDNNFIDINCAGLPEYLIESELFGHVTGSFTGADRNKDGLFKAANGGTLFMDEIGELPLAVQAKLLRVLQTGTIRPVGSNYNIKVDVRIVAASHHSLPQLVEEGKFRLDLYGRLSTIELVTTPLRVRRSDIKLIVDSLDKSGKIYDEIAKLRVETKEKVDVTDMDGQHEQGVISENFWEANEFPLNVRDLQRYIRRWELFGEL